MNSSLEMQWRYQKVDRIIQASFFFFKQFRKKQFVEINLMKRTSTRRESKKRKHELPIANCILHRIYDDLHTECTLIDNIHPRIRHKASFSSESISNCSSTRALKYLFSLSLRERCFLFYYFIDTREKKKRNFEIIHVILLNVTSVKRRCTFII